MRALFVAALSALVVVACTPKNSVKQSRTLPHLDLEVTSAEYMRLLSNETLAATGDAQALKPVLDLGKRNLDWLGFINEHRDSTRRISLTGKDTQQAFPVDQPREYNLGIVLKAFGDLKAAMPIAMQKVLLEGEPFTENPPISEDEYRTWGRKTDIVYQLAARWLLLSPYKDEYTKNRENDIRGYYYLSQEANLKTNLANWASLPPAKQAALRSWLIGICGNKDAYDQCVSDFADAVAQAGALQAFYDKYFDNSKKLYESFFQMAWPRTDIVWTAAAPNVMRIPFVDPKNSVVLSYLRDNIEDEFKWADWNLRMDFQAGDLATMSHLRFQAGVTPHVDLPNTIVMDENQPMTEYDSQWTIRHEFGHILGLPDCYVEFYDKDRELMVSYQLDITNLMCSRRGVFQQVHFDELKKTYFR